MLTLRTFSFRVGKKINLTYQYSIPYCELLPGTCTFLPLFLNMHREWGVKKIHPLHSPPRILRNAKQNCPGKNCTTNHGPKMVFFSFCRAFVPPPGTWPTTQHEACSPPLPSRHSPHDYGHEKHRHPVRDGGAGEELRVTGSSSGIRQRRGRVHRGRDRTPRGSRRGRRERR